MDLSVVIPTFRRHQKLRACVESLARQDTHADFEVLIGVDGEDAGAERVARDAWGLAGRDPSRLIIVQGPKAGLAAVRNRLIPHLRGAVVVSLNDDVIVQDGFLDAHARAHAATARPSIIVGRTPWRVHEPDSFFARLIRETSMIFFHDVMERDPDPARNWGFRHAWPLNLSVPARVVRDLAGWTVFPATYGFEDDDFAFRAAQRFSCPVLYRPSALAIHDHAMTPHEYLEREYRLGYASWGFAHASPECARAMFSRDITAEAPYSREFTRHQLADARRAWSDFRSLAAHPPDVFGDGASALAVSLAYQQHLPLKRWAWRRGHLHASEGLPMDSGAGLEPLFTPAAPNPHTADAPEAPPARTPRGVARSAAG
ncbi:MAG: glycosyltransferase family 2 protein [Leptolyngbya sp. PLA1]|nr:glycosyltransferase family 2 protein [Leptolyngbya sp. PLA1]